MKTVYCIAVETPTAGASFWYHEEVARDLALLRFAVSPDDLISLFSVDVSPIATPDEITNAVDNEMWVQEYVPTMRYTVPDPRGVLKSIATV